MGRRFSVKQKLRCSLRLGDVKNYSTALFNEGCAFLLGKDVAYGLLLRRANSVRPYMLYHYREVVLQFPGITLYLETAILLPVLFSHRKFHELDSEIMKF